MNLKIKGKEDGNSKEMLKKRAPAWEIKEEGEIRTLSHNGRKFYLDIYREVDRCNEEE